MRVLVAFACLSCLQIQAISQTWESPDGVFKFNTPSPDIFNETPFPPDPMLVVWVNRDESKKIAVATMAVPNGAELDQAMLELGLKDVTGGTITRLPTRTISGHEIFVMQSNSDALVMWQAVFLLDSTAYKLMAIDTNSPANDAHFLATLNTLTIMPASSVSTTTGQQKSEEFTARDFTRKVGGAALIVLIVIGIYTWLEKQKQKKTVGS